MICAICKSELDLTLYNVLHRLLAIIGSRKFEKVSIIRVIANYKSVNYRIHPFFISFVINSTFIFFSPEKSQ